jgi:hypothetical protein
VSLGTQLGAPGKFVLFRYRSSPEAIRSRNSRRSAGLRLPRIPSSLGLGQRDTVLYARVAPPLGVAIAQVQKRWTSEKVSMRAVASARIACPRDFDPKRTYNCSLD